MIYTYIVANAAIQPSWSRWNLIHHLVFVVILLKLSFLFEDASTSHSIYGMFLYAKISKSSLTRDPNVHRRNLRWPQIATKVRCNWSRDFHQLSFRPCLQNSIRIERTDTTFGREREVVPELVSLKKSFFKKSHATNLKTRRSPRYRPARALQITYRVLTQIIEAGPWLKSSSTAFQLSWKKTKSTSEHMKDGWKMDVKAVKTLVHEP